METNRELKFLGWMVFFFLVAYYLPVGKEEFIQAVIASLDLIRWYAREHVILCLLPAFLIAGVIAVFVSQGSVIKYFGARARQWVAYTVAAISGSILAVCSCTILPLFSSIYKRGAGLGPAIAFLYSGPAINILAIILTARILGLEMGIARVVGAVTFSIVIGLLMALIYRKEEKVKVKEQLNFPEIPEKRPMWQTSFHFFVLVFILIFSNWGKPAEETFSGLWGWIWLNKWWITAFFSILLVYSLIFILRIRWQWITTVAAITIIAGIITRNPSVTFVMAIAGLSFVALRYDENGDSREWILASWDFARQIVPLLAAGVLVAGFLLGSTHDDTQIRGIIPPEMVVQLVGGNSLFSNFFSAVAGAFMYFATLTEVPILQGLMASGMGKGPALALLLAGPSLSLPNMLVIRSVIGTSKTMVYTGLVIIMATFSGLIYGSLF